MFRLQWSEWVLGTRALTERSSGTPKTTDKKTLTALAAGAPAHRIRKILTSSTHIEIKMILNRSFSPCMPQQPWPTSLRSPVPSAGSAAARALYMGIRRRMILPSSTSARSGAAWTSEDKKAEAATKSNMQCPCGSRMMYKV